MTASDTAPGRGGGSTVGEAALAALVDAQREAVLAEDRVLCLLAGAGTGKTRVLTLRVARRLQDRSAHPNHVLVCTF
ncbi:MAG: UvrD-helicase domain-containing protein, partial [Acidimicrobiales bacterium]